MYMYIIVYIHRILYFLILHTQTNVFCIWCQQHYPGVLALWLFCNSRRRGLVRRSTSSNRNLQSDPKETQTKKSIRQNWTEMGAMRTFQMSQVASNSCIDQITQTFLLQQQNLFRDVRNERTRMENRWLQLQSRTSRLQQFFLNRQRITNQRNLGVQFLQLHNQPFVSFKSVFLLNPITHSRYLNTY